MIWFLVADFLGVRVLKNLTLLHIGRTRMEERKLLLGASTDGFLPLSLVLFLKASQWRDVFFLLLCSARVCLVGRHCLAHGGLFRDRSGG